MRVLVVEDEPVISQVCHRTLDRQGFNVTLCPDGRAAQECLQTSSFDLCLIDIRTPRMSGEELFNWIKGQRPEMVPGVVFTTGDVISNRTEIFLTEANRPYLPKPFSPSELLKIINEVMASSA
ncbi:response regulator [Dehalogenimonas sp. THU2]|uniref:response regulator n=1 Tax=Dehalogenimonas sp. THU2 TaxID=3151121 RepID=UPI0032189244